MVRKPCNENCDFDQIARIHKALPELQMRWGFENKSGIIFPNKDVFGVTLFNPTAFRKAKIVYNFGLSECSRVNLEYCSTLEKPVLCNCSMYSFPLKHIKMAVPTIVMVSEPKHCEQSLP